MASCMGGVGVGRGYSWSCKIGVGSTPLCGREVKENHHAKNA